MTGRRQQLLQRMTTNLFATYSHIHDAAKQACHEMQEEQERDPDYRINPGQVLNNRYVVQCSIGKGSFGQVVRALDTFANQLVAIKIIKRLRLFSQLARTEIRLLNLLRDRDPGQRYHIVQVIDWFLHDSHQCIVFEMLASNLYDVLRANHHRGLPLAIVRHIARQLLESLLFLKSNNIMNCDMKPENILLCAADRYDVKLIDFGSSCFTNEQMYTYIQSRFYRSPEVLLGLSLNTSIDMWSLGCILVELFTGQVLFGGANEVDQICKVINILGMPPAAVLSKAAKTKEYFILDQNNQFRFRHLTPGQPQGRTLSDILAVHKTRRFTKGRSERLRFLDLIERMLDYDATTRITPSEALVHAFIVDNTQSSTSKARIIFS